MADHTDPAGEKGLAWVRPCQPAYQDLERYQFFLYHVHWPGDLGGELLRALLDLAAPGDREEFAQLGSGCQALQFLVSRVMVRGVLGALLECRPEQVLIRKDERGKPHAPDTGLLLYLNYSHTRGHCLLGASRYGSIGVDVEAPGRWNPRLVRRFFHPQDQEHFLRLGPEEQQDWFFRAWVAKEACVKADGAGMRLLSQVVVGTGWTGWWARIRWQCVGLNPRVRAAVAVQADGHTHAPQGWGLLQRDLDSFLRLLTGDRSCS